MYDMCLFVYEIGSNFQKNVHVDKGLQIYRLEEVTTWCECVTIASMGYSLDILCLGANHTQRSKLV